MARVEKAAQETFGKDYYARFSGSAKTRVHSAVEVARLARTSNGVAVSDAYGTLRHQVSAKNGEYPRSAASGNAGLRLPARVRACGSRAGWTRRAARLHRRV